MSVSLYDPRVLMGVIRKNPVKPQFLRDTIFTRTVTHPTEAIDVDVVKGKVRIAPYVRPIRPGVTMARDGFQTKTFKPGYIKVKRPMTMDDLVGRLPGETIYDPYSPADRARMLLNQDLSDLNDSVDMAEEVQASQALTTGIVTMYDENGVAIQKVDFGLDDTHKVALSGTTKGKAVWSDTANADPIANLVAWVELIQEDSGYTPDFIYMAPDVKAALMAYLLAKNDQARMNALAIDRGTIVPGAPALPGAATYIGRLNEVGVPMYSYSSKYTDLSGNAQALIPSGKVIIGSKAGMNAVKQYGLIRDLDAGFATDRFAKSWVEPEPSARWLLVQSAPLLNPYNIDAYMFASVL